MNESPSIETFSDLPPLCRSYATTLDSALSAYAPTTQQLLYFGLIRLFKQYPDVAGGPNDPIPAPVDEFEADLNRRVINLTDWGSVVSDLKRGAEHEWLLLQVQLEASLRALGGERFARDEAAQEALVTLVSTLRKLHHWVEIEHCSDVPALVRTAKRELRNVYDFNSPFYAYAKLIARNFMRQHWRRTRREISVEHAESEPTLADTPEEWLRLQEEMQQTGDQVRRLRLELARLLRILQTELSPRQTDVVMLTLASRRQFWLALKLSDIDVGSSFPEADLTRSDAAIALALNLSENSVRVHRSTAKRRLQEMDSLLGDLCGYLLSSHG